jgi:hypothetical protein
MSLFRGITLKGHSRAKEWISCVVSQAGLVWCCPLHCISQGEWSRAMALVFYVLVTESVFLRIYLDCFRG